MNLKGRVLESFSHFDFVLFTETLTTPRTLERLGLAQLWLVAPSIPPPQHHTEVNPLYAKLSEGKFSAWFRSRNRLDVEVFDEVKRLRGGSKRRGLSTGAHAAFTAVHIPVPHDQG